MGREALVEWRKKVIAARENWLALKKCGDAEYVKLAKEEAANCLKHERACTQIIEAIDGKRVAPGELMGDKLGHLLYRVPVELQSAVDFCRGVYSYGLTT